MTLSQFLNPWLSYIFACLLLVILPAQVSAQSANPSLFEEEWVTAISHLRAQASWNGCSAGYDRQSAVWNPPPGWVVIETDLEVHSRSNGTHAVSTLAEGLELVRSDHLEDQYDSAIPCRSFRR